MAQAQQLTQAQIAQNNLLARSELISTGLHMTKRLQPQMGNLGDTVRIPLERMGVMTGITLNITAPVTITTATTQSPYGAYSLLKSVKYTDYAGIDRVSTDAFSLHAMNGFKGGRMLNATNDFSNILAGEGDLNTNILRLPTSISSDVINFSIRIPIAYDPKSDLRGAVLSQTVYGDHYVTVDIAKALVGTDGMNSPYLTGVAALTSGAQVTIEAYQDYIMPQNGVSNLPMIDLATIYAVEGNYQDTANINAGQSKFVNWPNSRAILSSIHAYNNGGVGTLNEADVSQITLLGNSNTNIRELSPRLLRNRMRYMMGGDIASGVYYMDARAQPVTTQIYGNVQSKFDIVTANAGAYIKSQYESFYMAGTPLPGVIG